MSLISNNLKAKLFEPYQTDGVEWMIKREGVSDTELHGQDNCKGGVLADEVGLGKTIMTIALILSNPKQNTLILVPKSLIKQWKTEIEKFGPSISLQVITEEHTIELNMNPKVNHVILMSQTKLNNRSSDVKSLVCLKLEYDRVIIDEAHSIKNHRSKLHKSCALLKTDIRWALTATPVMNKMTDFINLMNWIGVHKFICQGWKDHVVERYILRRTKVQVESFNKALELPPCIQSVHKVFLTKEEQKLYSDSLSTMKNTMKELKKSGQENAFKALEIILRMRQICTCPQSYYDGVYKSKRKYCLSDDIIEKDVWENEVSKKILILNSIEGTPHLEKCLVFCHFSNEVRMYSDALTEKKIRNDFLDGSKSIEERQSIISNFETQEDMKVLIIQIQTGGQGLNLQVANNIYITSPTWNPALQHQIIGRAHRTGQTKSVFVNIYVVTTDSEEDSTIEEKIITLQEEKQKMICEVMNEDMTMSLSLQDSKRILNIK